MHTVRRVVTEDHMKIGNYISLFLFQCQDTLVQFGTFLASSATEEYAKKIPAIDKLFQEYYVSADAAFFLWRPLLSNSITVREY